MSTNTVPQESEELLRLIGENVSDMIAVLDLDGRRIYNSESYRVFFGNPEALRGTESFMEIHPDDRERIRRVFEETVDTGVGQRAEFRFVLNNGAIRHIESQGNVVRDSSGKPKHIVVISRDITYRKLAEEEIRKRENHFRSLIEHSSDAIALLDAQGIIKYAGPSTERILGYGQVEFEGSNIFTLVHPEDVAHAQSVFGEILARSGASSDTQVRFLHKNGSWRWLEGVGTNLLADESVQAVVVNYRDITQKREAIDALQKSEELYRVFIDQSSEGIWRFELNKPMPLTLPENEQIEFFYEHAYLAQCNDAMAKMYGFRAAEELHGMKLANLLVRSEPQNFEYLRTFIRSGYRLVDGESHEPDNNGVMKYYLNNLVGFVEGGKLVRVWGTQRDISERKQTEGRLAILGHALKSVTEGVNLTDLDDNILFVNEAFQQIYGYTEQELIGQPITTVRSKRHSPELSETIGEQTLRGGWRGELWQRRKDGTEFLISLSTSVVRSDTGDPIAFMGVSSDITERTRAERLQNAVYQIAAAIDASPQLEDLYSAVHDIIGEVMPANNFYIALYDEKENLLHFPYFVDEVDIPSPAIKPGKGLTAYVLRTGKSLLCTEALFSELQQREEVELVGVPSPIWLGVPLIVANKTIGVMVVQHYSSPTAYGQTELHMLEYVSSQVAIAIERKRSEVALRQSEERYRRMFEDDLTGNFISTPDGKILDCNPAYAAIFGFASVQDALQSDCRTLHKDAVTRESLFELLRIHRKLEYYEMELQTKDGKALHVVANLIGEFDEQDNLVSVKGYLFDNTARRRLEDQLLQAQKMEAVGQLAAGIAHDFNNVMSVALSAAQLIKTQSKENDSVRFARMIEDTTLRGAAITRQLLQFSRSETVKLSPLSLSNSVTELKKILDHSFPKTIAINISINLKQGTIMGDEGQIHQMLLNLCINARDAMTPQNGQLPQGVLSITLESAPDAVVQEKFGDASVNQYVVLRVSDTGSGMMPDVKRRIFEPFYTTKEIGKGTGLGLSIVHGIMKSHHGHIEVTSEPNKGTTFAIYFPTIAHEVISEGSYGISASKGAGEKILVIEDEEILRELISEILSKSGYVVEEAKDGEEGVAKYKERPGDFGMVLSDMGLPKLSGEQVFIHLRRINPEVKVVFSTGHIREEKKNELLAAGAEDFVHKPYKIQEMLTSIRRVLDKGQNSN